VLVKPLRKSLLFCSTSQDFCLAFITSSQGLAVTEVKLWKQNASANILHLHKKV